VSLLSAPSTQLLLRGEVEETARVPELVRVCLSLPRPRLWTRRLDRGRAVLLACLVFYLPHSVSLALARALALQAKWSFLRRWSRCVKLFLVFSSEVESGQHPRSIPPSCSRTP
jgi:hypothetical protein